MEHGAGDDVPLLRWPEDRELAAALTAQSLPHLWLVEPGVAPPMVLPEIADWIRAPARPDDIAARSQTLLRRAAPLRLDDHGIVSRGQLWEAVPAAELAVLRPLMHAAGQLVGREVLIDAIRPGGDDSARALDTTMMRVRQRVKRLGVAIHTVKGEGFILEVGPLPAD